MHEAAKSQTGRKKYRLRRRLFNMLGAESESQNHACCEHEHHHDEEGGGAVAEGGSAGEVKELRDSLLRARADLENQRKRHIREKEELRKFATEELMRDMVPAMDHFGLAIHSLDTASDIHSMRQGVEMIHREILGVLKGNGLAEISPLGEKFDPARHEAVATEADPSKDDNTVVEVLRPGWVLNNRVLRPAMVKVNKPGA